MASRAVAPIHKDPKASSTTLFHAKVTLIPASTLLMKLWPKKKRVDPTNIELTLNPKKAKQKLGLVLHQSNAPPQHLDSQIGQPPGQPALTIPGRVDADQHRLRPSQISTSQQAPALLYNTFWHLGPTMLSSTFSAHKAQPQKKKERERKEERHGRENYLIEFIKATTSTN